MEAGPATLQAELSASSWLPCHPGCPSKVRSPQVCKTSPSKGPARSGSLEALTRSPQSIALGWS